MWGQSKKRTTLKGGGREGRGLSLRKEKQSWQAIGFFLMKRPTTRQIRCSRALENISQFLKQDVGASENAPAERPGKGTSNGGGKERELWTERTALQKTPHVTQPGGGGRKNTVSWKGGGGLKETGFTGPPLHPPPKTWPTGPNREKPPTTWGPTGGVN